MPRLPLRDATLTCGDFTATVKNVEFTSVKETKGEDPRTVDLTFTGFCKPEETMFKTIYDKFFQLVLCLLTGFITGLTLFMVISSPSEKLEDAPDCGVMWLLGLGCGLCVSVGILIFLFRSK